MRHILDTLRSYARGIVCPFERILSLVPPGIRVFDVGCGTGYFLNLVMVEKSPVAVGGSEINGALLEHTRLTLEPLASRAGTAVSLHVTDCPDGEIGGYDLITMVDVLHHIPRAVQAGIFEKLARAMKPGSSLLVKDIDGRRWWSAFPNRMHDLVFNGGGGQERDPQWVADELARAGLRLEERGYNRRLWYPHYWFVFTKGDGSVRGE